MHTQTLISRRRLTPSITQLVLPALLVVFGAIEDGAAQIIFSDNFESGNLNNWTATAATPNPLEIATPTNVVPVGGAFSAYLNISADRMHRNIIADNGGTELGGHSVATWYIYDAGGTASRVFNEVRGYSAGTGLPNGGTTANGALAQLFAAGKYNTVTLPAEVFDGTKYQARVTFGASAGWFNLNAAGAPNRSIGWHKFSVERMADETTINFYVDGKLGRTISGATADSWDTIILGPGLGTTVGDAWIDGFVVMTGVPVISTQPQSQAIVSGGSVTFTVADAGGITYQWKRNGADITDATASSYTLNNLSSADSGNYSVVVGNSAGSTTSSEASLSVVPGITTQPANQTNCVGTTAGFSVTAIGEAPLSYQWYFNSATALTDETNAVLTITNVQSIQAGNYSVIVTNNGGSVTSIVAALVVNLNPSVTVNSETICEGSMASLTAATVTANPTYLWSPGGSTASSITVSPAATTTYTVTVTDSDTGCTATGSGTVTVNPRPTVAVNSQAICAGGSATLTAITSAATPSYLWSPGGAVTPSIMVSPSETTVYSVIVTDGVTACANSGSGTVTVTPVPTVAVNSLTVCAGSPATLTATTSAANPSYLWTPGGATTASITVSPTETTVYSVSVTDGGAPCPNSASGTVTVTPVAPVTVNSETICAGASATLTATTTAASPTYLWSPGGATTSSITVSPEITTNYTVTVTDGTTGCTSSGSGVVTVNPLPTVTVNSVGICPGGSATLTAATTAATPTYLWSPGGETTASITVSPASTTVYSVTVTDGTTTCAKTASGTVTVNPAPTVAVNSETICAGNSATLTATTTATTPTYLWSPGGATTASITVSPASTTTYTVMVTDGSPDCVNSASGTVTVNPLPTVAVNSETICAGGSASLLATTSAANPTYLWSPGGETTASIMVTPGSTTVYTVTVTDGTTTCPASGSGTVTVNPLPTVTVNSPTICLGDSATLTATTSAANPTYLWSPGGETTASISVSPTTTTSYSVTVTDGVTTCGGNGSGTVTVKQPVSFANSAAIAINDNSSATPYPSVISVSGQTATVCRVTVTLNNLSHPFPDDIDIVLVGPNGQGVLLMSDVGNADSLSGVTLNFDDSAASSLPDSGAIASGNYKPTNYGSKDDGRPDNFAAPAPVARFGTNLSAFAGINPNGNWSLYVVDDEAVDFGAIANGWSIAITTQTPFADVSVAQASIPNPVAAGSNLTFTVTVANNGPADAADVSLSDTLPAGVTFVSATPSQGSCTPGAGTVSCSLGDILAGGSATVSIVVVPSVNSILTNDAVVTSATLDFFAANNASSTSATVLDAPAITVQPVAQTVCVDQAISLTVTATGSAPLSYQWSKDNVAIDGATAATFNISSAVVGNSGTYTVVVANSVGAAVSSGAAVVVNPLPVVAVNSETICLGGSAVLTATTSAANPIFLWSPGGAITASITVNPASTTIYTVLVTDGVTGCTNSASGTVTVNPLTAATAIPSYTNVCPGTAVTFSTVASGTPPFSYEWRKDGIAIDGATTDTLSLPSVVLADSGTYSVVVTGTCGAVTNSGTLSVVAPPTITSQPVNQTTPMGNGAVFTVAASSVVASNIQWQLNGVDISGATGTSLAVSNLTLADNGGQYRAVISNCGGSTTSVAAILSVTPIFGISFDFNTPNQYSNAPFNLKSNNWMSSAIVNGLNNPFIPTIPFEVPAGGAGGSGALDLAFNNGTDHGNTLLPTTFDFSLPGKTLTASIMVKVKVPTAVQRATQIGFITTTNINNAWQQINANNGLGFMSAIFQSTLANNPNYMLRAQYKVISGTTAIETFPINTTSNQLSTNTWYKLVAKFVNTKGSGLAASNYTVEASLQNMGADGQTPGAVVLAYPPTLQTNVDLVNHKNLFFCIRGFENGGIDYWDNVYITTASGPVAFVQQPQSQTILQGRQAGFRALVDGDGPYTYQWNKNGTPIPGAGSWNYTTPPLALSDNGAEFTVTVTSPNGSLTSDPAVITVQAEELNVVSAGSVEGSIIGVRFDQPVDKASAEVGANYTVNGVPAYAAQLRPNGTDVLVSPAAPVSGPFTVTVANVTSLSGTALGVNNSASGVVAGLTGYDVNPLSIGFNGQVSTYPGENYSFAPGSFEVTGGGHDIFGNFDGFRFVYMLKTGDFDVKMRVPYLDLLRTPNKAGFVARASLDAASPSVFAGVNPMLPGRNIFEGTVRQAYNVGTTSWGNGTFATYPNTWLRFRRVGNTFMRYSSTNGVNWLFDGQTSPNPVFPETVYFGLAVCANVGGGNLQQMVRAELDGYGDFAGYSGAVITLVSSPTNITISAGGATTLGATATVSGGGIPASAGELSYVWQRENGAGGWTNLVTGGATNNTASTGNLFASDSGAQFRVVVSAPGALSVTSAVAVVTVTDTAAPTVAASALPTLSSYQLVVTFSEPLSAATGLNPANYTVTNSAGANMGVASVAFLGGDPRVVVITTVNLLVPGTYGVRFGGLQDLNGNAIAANTVRTFLQQTTPPLAPVVVDIYTDLQNTPADITALTANVKYVANTPDFIVYSNLFGINPAAGTFPDTLNHYGAKIYTYFVPTNTGIYKFYVRADDFAQFLMNTNAVGSTNPAGAVVQAFLTVNNQSYNPTNGANLSVATNFLNAGQRYYMELRYKETTGGDGGTVAIRTGTDNAIPAQGEVIPAALCAFPDAIAPRTPIIAELYTGLVTVNSQFPNQNGAAFGNGGYPDLIVATNTFNFRARVPNVIGYEKYFGFRTNLSQLQASFDNYLGRIYSYFVAPSNGLYRFYIRGDDAHELWMNTNSVNSTDPAGARMLGVVNDFIDVNYRLAGQNVSLVGGQRYYIEGRWREGTGGDGMTVAVRSQGDTAVPGQAEVIPGSMFEFPTNLAKIGALTLAGIDPSNPTVSEGQSITFNAVGIGGALPYNFVWLKNGVQVFANNVFYVTPPLTLADNGAVITLLVTNQFSVTSQSATITVLADTTAPTLVSAVASPYAETVTVTFSEAVDGLTAACLANYRIDGLAVLSADWDEINRNRVFLRTSPLQPNTGYTLTVSGVRDASAAGNLIAPGSSITFSGWGTGGRGGVYVEIFTNVPGSAVGNLTQDPKYINNRPDVTYYTNIFAVGLINGDSGLNNYGARVSGYYTPPSNGLYRFFLRSDDGSQLFMNTNGPSPAGRVMIARNDGANPSTFDNGLGLGVAGANVSPILSLNADTAYYLEGLLKEGGGGDHLDVALRAVDPSTLTIIGALPAVNVLGELLTGGGFSAPGNPDVNRMVINQAPPAELFVAENDKVTLSVSASIVPQSVVPFTAYQWQRAASASEPFVNIPGATAASYVFYPPLADDGARYRINVSIPGTNVSFVTLFHVVTDTLPPFITAASSLDGKEINLCFNERLEALSGADPFNYTVNSGANNVLNAVLRADGVSVILTLETPVTGDFTVDSASIVDLASSPNTGNSSTNGYVQGFLPFDVGAPAGIGSSFSCIPGEIDVVAGGNDIWGASDVGHLTLTPRYGDFDIYARVQSLSRGAADNDGITKAGLMVRESTNANSRTLHLLVNPQTSIGGRDQGESARRINTGAATAIVPGSAVYNPGSGAPVGIPNAWIRIKRVGDVYTTFRSYDGVNWVTVASLGFGLPDPVLIGLGTSAHVPVPSASTTLAEYRNIYIPNIPTILVQPAPASQTVLVHGTVAYSVVASNPPNSGPLTYQWRKDGVKIAGATTDTLTLNDVQAGHSGVYTVWVGNDGGATISSPVTLAVNNSSPVAATDTLSTPSDVALNTPVGDLLANDSDANGDTVSILAVSGLYPASFVSDFNSGLPAGSVVFGSATAETSGGAGGSGYLRLNQSINSQTGSFILDDLTPRRRVSAFTASFKLRISEGSAQPADGFSFNFAQDLPISATTPAAAENGGGSGLSFCVDNYQFAPFPAGGTANTSGLKLRYGGVNIAGVQIPTWDRDAFIPVTVSVDAQGNVNVFVDGTNVFGNVVVPWVPRTGRFGFYARTGGERQAHAIDDLNIALVNTVETAREASLGGSIFGNAYVDGGFLHLNDAVAGLAGSFVLNELTPGVPITSFTAEFKLRIGNGSAEPADGFSFNFANDLPLSASTPLAAENGGGTGFSFCVDNYRFLPFPGAGGTANTSGMKILLGGVEIAGVQIPTWNSTAFIPVSITLASDGVLTVLVNGTNVFGNLPLPVSPSTGRFGLYARTGGQFQTHWVDDLSINVTTAGSPASFSNGFNAGGFGTVALANNVVTYSPPSGACGTDTYYYLATDGQAGSVSIGTVNVNLIVPNPQPPVILACPASRTIEVGANCQAAIPDLTASVSASDCATFVVSQSPASGTLVGPGATVVTLTVSNSYGLTTTCQATVTVVDTQAPQLVSCAAPPVLSAGVNCSAELPDLRSQMIVSDACPVTFAQVPAPGTVLPRGNTTVVLTATDSSGNSTNCEVIVLVIDATAPAIVCPADIVVACTGASGAVVNFAVTALDNCDANPVVTSLPASGSTFAIGTNVVTSMAVDAAGNTNTCTFRVVVQDSPVPTMTIVRQGANVVITWPQTCTPYVLEETSVLGTGASWETSTATVETVGTDYRVTVPATDNKFYRLKKQP